MKSRPNLPIRKVASSGMLSLFGDRHQTSVKRAIAELSLGRSVIVQHDSRQMVAAAAEFSAGTCKPSPRGGLASIAAIPASLIWSAGSVFPEEAVFRPRQTQMLAQRGAFVLPTEDAAPLQLWHHLVDEGV